MRTTRRNAVVAHDQDGGAEKPAAPPEIYVFVLGRTHLPATPNGFPEFWLEDAE